MRVIVVGAGVVGTLHAWHAVERGHEVVQIEREAEARGASLRNSGQYGVSGRAGGEELETALRARELWEESGHASPTSASGRADEYDPRAQPARTRRRRGRPGPRGDSQPLTATSCSPDEARAVNPALRGAFEAALFCERDAAVEPRTAQLALRAELSKSRLTRSCRAARSVTSSGNTPCATTTGTSTPVTSSCCARAPGSVVSYGSWPSRSVRRVRLQMMQTEPLGEPLTTSVADAEDGFRTTPRTAAPPSTSSTHTGRRRRSPPRTDAAAHGAARGQQADHRQHPRVRAPLPPSTPSKTPTTTSPRS